MINLPKRIMTLLGGVPMAGAWEEQPVGDFVTLHQVSEREVRICCKPSVAGKQVSGYDFSQIMLRIMQVLDKGLPGYDLFQHRRGEAREFPEPHILVTDLHASSR